MTEIKSGHVSASTQNQALGALLFLHVRVLAQPTAWLSQFVHAKRPERLPATLTAAEVMAVLDQMNGPTRPMASLLYGSELRRLECTCLRVKDLDLERREVVVRDGKGRAGALATARYSGDANKLLHCA